jgi:hypothetical protein
MAAFGAVALNDFFIKPYYSFTIDTGEGVTAFLVYAAVALTVAAVAGQLREARAIADTLSVSAAARISGKTAILTYGATAALLEVEMPSGRCYAVDLPEGGRIAVDAGRRITREQQQVVDALARVLGARAGPDRRDGAV